MWFLNQETGCIWEVTNQELMLRLQTSGHYEQVDEPKPDEAEQDLPQTKVQTVRNMKRTEKEQVTEVQETAHE
ncbi:hypothetical protein UY286_15535 [Paenibacillus polymyxa]|uniref:hypothetical protein n=1 Tax=Paenibacillus polymyxa TaxID=1406 RepID=UPI002AB37B28|nr:hypothetical protein [Paenibacillus polymyxa]MDY7992408.1 hypothetical protein [Paenibacillus polymyxa]MDY8118850.1 hypothetical protein [Paenibacillus polymyxa]